MGWALACRRTGAAHARGGKPCQDAYAVRPGDACLALAVADGHGDDRHDLSQFGAQLAVEAAVRELLAFHAHFGLLGSPAALKNSFRADFPRRAQRAWRAAVLDDARQRLGEAADRDERLFSRYGSTLLAALVCGEAVLLGQIGDGDAVRVRPGGDVEHPLPADEAQVGGATDSIAGPEAGNRWRTACLEPRDGGLLLLATDGLATAFTDAGEFDRFARSLTDRLREFGREPVAAALPGWLDHYSAHGSGDDMTLALVELGSPSPSQG